MGSMQTPSELVELWRASPRVVVLTGAGVSTDSGISDFRGPNGLWTRNPGAQAMFDIDTYMRDPEVRRRAWANRRENPPGPLSRTGGTTPWPSSSDPVTSAP